VPPSLSFIADPCSGWYTERVPTNRMSLSLQSGIESEVSWALDRLCRVSGNDQFLAKPILGLADALYVWPEWYIQEGHDLCRQARTCFSVPRELERKRRNALESLFVLRCLAANEQNTHYLATHARTLPFLLSSLHAIDPSLDENSEFTLLTIEYFQLVAPQFVIPSSSTASSANPLQPLQAVAVNSTNRPTIIAAFNALTSLLTNPRNSTHVKFESPCLEKCLQYLPLIQDQPLMEACLDFLYSQLASPPIAQAFLLRDDMSTVLRLLIMQIHKQQVEESATIDVLGPVSSVPWDAVPTRPHDLTPEELRTILPMTEPERCLQWYVTSFAVSMCTF
jgi:chromatin structure-remodeling complex subunit RSC9